MPAGCLLDSVLIDTGLAQNSDTTIRPVFYDSIDFSTAVTGFGPVSPLACGTWVTGVPIPVISQSLVGCEVTSYVDIFYNRVVVEPNPLDVGNITFDTTKQLTVFNAFFTPKTLDNIIPTNLVGVNITGPALPVVLEGLQEIVYNVEFLISVGPPSINGTFLFDFEVGINSITVIVLGTRVVAFPYLFQPGLQETVRWNTQVMTSNDGSEQRTRLRNAPRQFFAGNMAIPMGRVAALDTLLYGWRTNSYALPVSSECRQLTSPVAINDTTIQVNTDFADFRVDGLIMIYKSPKDFELLIIQSFTSSSIVVTTGATKAFDISALVMPTRIARMLSSPIRNTDGNLQRLGFSFQVTDNIVLATSASATQYKGLDVYLKQPLTIDKFAIDTYTSRVDVIDFQSGITATFAPWKKTKIQRQFGDQFETQGGVWSYRLWLHRRAGKHRPFWMPTFENNLNLITETGLLDVHLIIVDDGQAFLSSERNDLAIRTTDGNWLFREIASITPSGSDLDVTVTTNIGIDASLVDFISFMGRKRLTSDSLEIIWGGNNSSAVTVPITEINN